MNAYQVTAIGIGAAWAVVRLAGPVVSDWINDRRQREAADAADTEEFLDRVAGAAPADDDLDWNHRTAAQARADFQRSVELGFIQIPDFTERPTRRQP